MWMLYCSYVLRRIKRLCTASKPSRLRNDAFLASQGSHLGNIVKHHLSYRASHPGCSKSSRADQAPLARLQAGLPNCTKRLSHISSAPYLVARQSPHHRSSMISQRSWRNSNGSSPSTSSSMLSSPCLPASSAILCVDNLLRTCVA